MRLRAGERILLDDVSLDVESGELIAIVGPNGVGKTTLLRTLAGFVVPDAGDVVIDGEHVRDMSARRRAQAVTLIGDDAETPHGTSVREVVATGRFSYRPWWDWGESDSDAAAVEAALRRVGLDDAAERPFDSLSSGERQRGWLALALAQSARLVLLDEPTSHLDPRYALEVLRLIRSMVDGVNPSGAREARAVEGRELASEPTSAFVVLHDLNEAAAVADRIAIFGNGRLLRCAPPSDALDPEILERAFGVSFERLDGNGAVRVFPASYPTRVSTGT